jgi:hypothetical protein
MIHVCGAYQQLNPRQEEVQLTLKKKEVPLKRKRYPKNKEVAALSLSEAKPSS